MDPTARDYVFWVRVGALVLYAIVALLRLATPVIAGSRGPQSVSYRERGLLSLATFLVGFSVLVAMMAPVHLRVDPRYAGILEQWRASLPSVAIVSGAAAFFACVLGSAGALRSALAVSWPPAMYAAVIVAAYVALARLVPPDDPKSWAELSYYTRPAMTLVLAIPAIAFVSSLFAGRLGCLLRSQLPPESRFQ